MEARRQFSRLGWAYVVFFLVAGGAQLLVTMGVSLLWLIGRGSINANVLLLLSQFCMYGIAFPVFYLLVRRIPAWEMTKPRCLGVGTLVMCAILCFGLTYIGNLLGQFLMRSVGAMGGVVPANPVDHMVLDLSPWVMFLGTVLLAPVVEELMFRKFLMDRIVPYGQKLAVVVSGVGFGLFHGNFYQFFYACALGMVFAYLYSNTGRIRYCIWLHMMINFIGGFVSLLLVQGAKEQQFWASVGLTMQAILMIGSIITAIVLILIYRKRLKWFPAWLGDSGRGKWKHVVFAPGVVGFLVMSAGMFALHMLAV